MPSRPIVALLFDVPILAVRTTSEYVLVLRVCDLSVPASRDPLPIARVPIVALLSIIPLPIVLVPTFHVHVPAVDVAASAV